MIGTKLVHYEITNHIGSGGMGDVYQATDTKLGRSVAIKFLPEPFSHDTERVARFEREARLLASLNHSNIAAIHGLEESQGRKFLVMELVEGETLADRIKRGRIPVDESLHIAKQICEALEAAHEKGVIHRDLKPANVKITPDGKVKVLDFGLAKAFEAETSTAPLSNSPTLSMAATNAGVILGTAAYMSPEQARGKPADKRTDIWAFGCVLYELLTGKQAFSGETITDIIAKVLQAEPDGTALPQAMPPNIRSLLRRCLQKDLQRRLRDASDVRIEIEEAQVTLTATLPVGAPAIPEQKQRRILQECVGALVLVAITSTIVWNLRPAPPVQPRAVERFAVALPPNTTLVQNQSDVVALSPDGRQLTYVASRSGEPPRLYLRTIDALEATPLAGTEGASSPFYSPDSQWIGFFLGGDLMKISVSGGAAQTLYRIPTGVPTGATWGVDDTIVFAGSAASGLMKVSATGGEAQPLTNLQPGESSHRWPQFLPDGKTVVFTVGVGGTFDNAQIAGQRLDSAEHKVLIRGGTFPRYAPSGQLVYYRAGTLMAAVFDPSRLELKGPPAPVVEGILADPNGGAAQFSLSHSGSLAYIPGSALSRNTNLVWVDRRGTILPLAAPPRSYIAPKLSPDARQIAVGIGSDIWIYDVLRETLTRFTYEASNTGTAPKWTPDGKRIVFPSNKGGATQNLFWKPADGSGSEERLTTSQYNQNFGSFSPDGRVAIFTEVNPKTGQDLWILPMDGERKPHIFLQTPFEESFGQFSPDGRWIAYVSNESGRQEVYVRPYPGPGGKWQVSPDGGSEMAWAPKGGELFYRSGPQKEKMMVVGVQTQPSFSVGKPRMLFEGPYSANCSTCSGAFYSVSADGQRLLMMKASEQQQTALTQIHIVLNWFTELQQRVPVK